MRAGVKPRARRTRRLFAGRGLHPTHRIVGRGLHPRLFVCTLTNRRNPTGGGTPQSTPMFHHRSTSCFLTPYSRKKTKSLTPFGRKEHQVATTRPTHASQLPSGERRRRPWIASLRLATTDGVPLLTSKKCAILGWERDVLSSTSTAGKRYTSDLLRPPTGWLQKNGNTSFPPGVI